MHHITFSTLLIFNSIYTCITSLFQHYSFWIVFTHASYQFFNINHMNSIYTCITSLSQNYSFWIVFTHASLHFFNITHLNSIYTCITSLSQNYSFEQYLHMLHFTFSTLLIWTVFTHASLNFFNITHSNSIYMLQLSGAHHQLQLWGLRKEHQKLPEGGGHSAKKPVTN